MKGYLSILLSNLHKINFMYVSTNLLKCTHYLDIVSAYSISETT